MRRPSLFFDIGAEDQSGRAFSSLQSALSETDRRAQRTRQQIMAFGAAAVAAVTAVGVAALRGASQIDEVAKAARRLEMDVTSFRALQLVASEAGVSVEGLANDIQNANREIERSSAGATRAAQALGLSIADLGAMDSNARLEAIADRMQEMGLTAGQASQVLRDFGIRNREMVLMMMQGGDAFRNARRDINDYGLALSQVDASRIETANDQISRLGYLSQFAADRLALAIVPALGSMANAIMESMREGGRLRGFLEALPGFATAAAIAITAYYTPAILAATFQTAAWVASLVTLKGALLATGIGAFIVLAGTMINYMLQLVEKTGGWGNALVLLGQVAAGVWQGITTSASAIPLALNATWDRMKAGFQTALAVMAETWQGFLQTIASGLSMIPGIGEEAAGMMDGAIGSAGGFAQGQRNLASMSNWRADTGFRIAGRRMAQGFDEASAAAGRLRDAVAGVGEFAPAAIEQVTASAQAMNEVLEQTPAAAGGAGQALGETAEAAQNASSVMDRVKSSFENAFVSFVTGAASAKDAIRSLLQDLAKLLAQRAFQTLFGNMFGGKGGGFFASLFGGARAEGGPVTGGKTYLVGERGPELFTAPNSGTIIPNHAMGGGKSGGNITISIDARGAVEGVADQINAAISRRIPEIARASSAYGTDRALRGYGA